MSGFEITSNAGDVAGDIAAIGFKAGARAVTVTRHYGMLLQAGVVRRASLPRTGPPGPRLLTGNYVRSITLRVDLAGVTGGAAAVVGTNAPQGRRLELGFSATDSRGRRYHQPPYPHFGPALDEIAPLFAAGISALGVPT